MTAVFVLLILGLPVSSVTAAVPTLTTPDIAWVSGAANKKSSATDTTARIGANITDIGGFNITAHGTVWKAGSSPVITDNPLDNGAGTLGVFYQNRTGLPAGSQIFFKGYATNSNNDTGLSPDGTFYTEPAAQPTGVTISNINYFSMTVSWNTLPVVDTDGVLVVMQAQRPVNEIPYDGTVYTANAAFGTGNELIQYERDYVVYDGPGTSVDVTNLQAGVIYHVALFAYKGSGTGAGGINYINDFTVATASATTIPTTGFSHNEQNIPAYQTNTGCANCHGSHHTTDVLPRGLAQYNRCFVCHSAGGGANPNIGLHLADGSIDCGTCHTMHSFKTKELYSDATAHGGTTGFNQKFIRSNMSKYLNTTDFTPPVGPPKDALDNTVFQNPPGDFAFADGATPYNGVCQTCHTQTKFHNQAEPTVNTHRVGKNCTSCHSHSSTDEYNAFQPAGGHLDTDFGWNEAVDNCDDCHSANPGTPTEAVVSSIHSNNCDLCHVGGVYDKTSNGVDPLSPNGIDGDAYMAEGAADWSTPFLSTKYTCTTCHDPAAIAPDLTPTQVNAASYGGIHHNNATDGVLDTATPSATCTTTCHASTSHNATIADSGNVCDSCHINTADTAGTGAPISGTLGDPLIHDDCTTCHGFGATGWDGILATVTAVRGLTAGQLPSPGGDCVNCHNNDGTTRPGRAAIHHVTTVATTGNCQVCHVNDYDVTGVGGPTVVDVKQLACRECHVDTTSGNLVIDALLLSDAHDARSAVTQNFIKINGASVATHAIAGVTEIKDYRACFACHNGSDIGGYAGDAPVVKPFHGFSNTNLTFDPNSTNGTQDPLHVELRVTDSWPIALNWLDFPIVFAYQHPGHNSFRRFAENNLVAPGIEGNCRDNSNSLRNSTGAENHYRRNNPPTAGGVDWRDYVAGEKTSLAQQCGNMFRTPVTGYALRIPSVPYNQFGAGGGPYTNLPRFDNVAATNDRIFVNSAEVDATNYLIVVASNDEGCGLLSVTGYPGTFTLNGTTGYCVYTSTSTVAPVPATIDVVSSGTGNPSVLNFPVVDNTGPVAATASADNLAAADTGNTILDVLANDSGSALEVVVATVSGVTQTGGAGTCGTLTPTTTNVTYTGGGGTATCTFTYEAQAYDGATPFGAASQATATVNQSANAPPAFGSPTYNATPVASVGVAYTSTSPLNAAIDPESDPITYTRNGGTCGVWASVAGADGAISGTPVVGDLPNCTVVLRATATGGFDEATATVTVNNTPPFTDWTEDMAGFSERQQPFTMQQWTTGSSQTNNWMAEINATTSAGVGPSTWVNQPYIYTEASNNSPGTLLAGAMLWVESPALDASTYSFALDFDYNTEGVNADTILEVYVDDGGGFVKHGATIVTGATSSWVNTGVIDLSAYTSAIMKIRIQYTMGTGSMWNNDCSLDNITVNGTP